MHDSRSAVSVAARPLGKPVADADRLPLACAMNADFRRQRLWAEAAKVLEDRIAADRYWRLPVDSALAVATMRMVADPLCTAIDRARKVHPLVQQRLAERRPTLLLLSRPLLDIAVSGTGVTGVFGATTVAALAAAAERVASDRVGVILSTPSVATRLGRGSSDVVLPGIPYLDVAVPIFVPEILAAWSRMLPALEALTLHPAESTWEVSLAQRLCIALATLQVEGAPLVPCEHPDPEELPRFPVLYQPGQTGPHHSPRQLESLGRAVLAAHREDRVASGSYAPLIDIVGRMAEMGLQVRGPRLGLVLSRIAGDWTGRP